MSLVGPRAVYAEAQRLFGEGRLQSCREVTEDLLLALSSSSSLSPSPSPTTAATTAAAAGGGGESCASGLRGAAAAAGGYEGHALFANALMLLSSCYSAVGSFDEADRLLATCHGYVQEHMAADNDGDGDDGSGSNNSSAAAEGRFNIALASVAYSRGAIRLEQYRTLPATPLAVVEEADAVFLADAERRLANVLGIDRLLLADVLHCRGVCSQLLAAPSPSSPSSSPLGTDAPSYLRALSCYSRSLDIRSRYADGDGVVELKLALTLEHVAHLLRLAAPAGGHGRRQEALRLLSAVAAVRARLLGPRHPLTASTTLAEGAIAAELGKYSDARRALAAALAAVQEVYDDDDVRVAEVQYWRARVS